MTPNTDTDEELWTAWAERGKTVTRFHCFSCHMTLGHVAATKLGLVARVDDALHRDDAWATIVRTDLRNAGRPRLANRTFHTSIVRLVRVADRSPILFACRCNRQQRPIEWARVDDALRRGHPWVAV